MKSKSSDYNSAPTAGMEPRPLLLQLGLLAILVASTSLLLVACKSMNSSVSAGNRNVVLTRKGKAISYYIDGDIDNSKTMDGIANVNNSGMFRAVQSVCVPPGVGGSDGTRPFVGELDRIDLFDRALSTAEISAFHRAGRQGKSSGSAIGARTEESALKPAHTNAIVESGGLYKTVIDTNSGQYVIVSPNRQTLILKDRFDKVIWSTNVVERLKEVGVPGEKWITSVEILNGVIIINVGREFATVNKRTGEVTFAGAD